MNQGSIYTSCFAALLADVFYAEESDHLSGMEVDLCEREMEWKLSDNSA